MLSSPTAQLWVIPAYSLAHVSAGGRHHSDLLYLKDSSEQVIALYLQHTVCHLHTNRVGKCHFHIHFFVHFCFTKDLCREKVWNVRFLLPFSVPAFLVSRRDVRRCCERSRQHMSRLGETMPLRAHFPLLCPCSWSQGAALHLDVDARAVQGDVSLH